MSGRQDSRESRFKEAVSLFKAGKYEEALETFNEVSSVEHLTAKQ